MSTVTSGKAPHAPLKTGLSRPGGNVSPFFSHTSGMVSPQAISNVRHLVLPPSDRAHWRAPVGNSLPLHYLAWGSRQFGTAPIAQSFHSGWTYVVVESGCPTLILNGRSEKIVCPALLILGPDCPFGWGDSRECMSKLMVWVWQRPLHPAIANLRSDEMIHHELSGCELSEFRRLHALSRNEVYRADTHAEAALGGLQALLEARIVRVCEGREGDSRKEAIDRALHWIEEHVATRQPLSRLADFMGVSPATIQRLFRERLGTTVMKMIAEIRRREAERMLRGKGVTIKEVAYHLGYRHPHDFSRAFRNHTGKLPSRCGFSEKSASGISAPTSLRNEAALPANLCA
ncbi:hypothetical protein CMV30_18720 [Nibricoccus aquaticus]|uniref:HTH araC/xylS-type domain-containing protein n=1 Tax=Nibricoccus aquaticus TaxID=2576891 RepID=A0A290QKE6_9BACT|nr:AraC family transcriptional regulator [Nibricoccus aquaticus]ATC65818.1 hypothetical protein CMV30_18720 [Nibricoccus aquaticus]